MEIKDLIEGDFALKSTGRYAHNKEYVTDLLIRSGQTVLDTSAIIPRLDSDKQISGRLFLSKNCPPG